MRDINRIERITQKFQCIWEKVPDWRFHQLISNLFGDNPMNFYQEDDIAEKILDNVLSQTVDETPQQ